jgi:hypothetical protein
VAASEIIARNAGAAGLYSRAAMGQNNEKTAGVATGRS